MLKERILSGITITAICCVFVFFSGVPFVLNIAVGILSAAALFEVLVVTKYVESKSLITISTIFAFLIPFIPDFTRTAFTLGIFIYTLILFITLLFAHKTFSLEHLSVVFLMSLVIPYFFATIIYSRRMDGGLLNLVLIFLCAWGTDTGGYIFGRMFGRHKLTPVISPKKTIEGAVGGVLSSITALLIVSYALDVFVDNLIINYPALAIFTFLGSLMAIFGDLVASLIKRSFGVKDFGKLIPGHGGIMDRFDSVLFVAPIMYFLLMLLPVFNVLK